MCTMDEIHHPTISSNENSDFHAIDRALYSMLVFDLWRDPVESLEVMALWILFERRGLLKNFVNFMFSLHSSKVAYYADEALACLQAIKEEGLHTCLRALLGSTLTYLQPFFPDILRDALGAHSADDTRVEELVAERNHRTMCMTFSRGYPVDEIEVRALFTALFGMDCIEAFYMQKSPSPANQPLYARIIFTSTAVVDKILNGAGKAKLTVNKKQFWLRKFVTKARPAPA